MRAAADAGQAGVKAAHAGFQGRVDIGQAKPAGIVEMAAPEALAGNIERTRKQLAHHARVGIADGIGQADAVGAGI